MLLEILAKNQTVTAPQTQDRTLPLTMTRSDRRKHNNELTKQANNQQKTKRQNLIPNNLLSILCASMLK